MCSEVTRHSGWFDTLCALYCIILYHFTRKGKKIIKIKIKIITEVEIVIDCKYGYSSVYMERLLEKV